MLKIRLSSIGFCVLGVVMVVACHKPRSDTYRRIEFFSAGKSKIAFTCLVGIPTDTFRATTPWSIEMDLDTMDGSWPYRIRVLRAEPGPDKLWVWGFDRDSLRLAKYLATQFDNVDFDMRYWICWQGKP